MQEIEIKNTSPELLALARAKRAKVCSCCHTLKPLEEFGIEPNGFLGTVAKCRTCVDTREAERAAALALDPDAPRKMSKGSPIKVAQLQMRVGVVSSYPEYKALRGVAVDVPCEFPAPAPMDIETNAQAVLEVTKTAEAVPMFARGPGSFGRTHTAPAAAIDLAAGLMRQGFAPADVATFLAEYERARAA
ncbi:hypothetical protein AB4Y42_06115 [Paraburkholderia sp. EG286B]|uniref:hypothetical protein n=1 Tax=Paraburkholderia sp. EG286B TaxID=3237011 RepID=UPI0034D38ABC